MWFVIFRRWVGCLGTGVFWALGASASFAAQDSQTCKAHFHKKEYNEAASCFETLAKREPQNAAHVYNQALVILRWADASETTKPSTACRLRLRALEHLIAYEKRTSGDEQVRVAAQIRKLQTALALGRIHVVTVPSQARLRLRGSEYEKQAASPFLFDALCPGRYTLDVEASGFSPSQQAFTIESGKTHAQTISLQALPTALNLTPPPDRRRLPDLRGSPPLAFPPEKTCPRLLPALALFGVAALLLGGGSVTTALATGANQQMQENLPRSIVWKEHYQTALTMEWTSGAFFVSAGVAAVTGLALLFILKQPCPVALPPVSPR